MNSRQNIYVALIAFLDISMTIAVQPAQSWVHQGNNLNLMSLMSRANDIMQRDPIRSLECFNYYIPLINAIAEKYQKQFNACLKASEESRADAEAATSDRRKNLASRSVASCELLSQCGEVESTEEVFECYVNGGSQNARSMYSINADAADHLAEFQENLRLISVVEHKCTNDTKRTYEKDSNKAYIEFDNCVKSLSEVPKPTDAPTTEAPSTDAPATNAPATDAPATDAPATDAPENPENPESPEVSPEARLPEEDIDMVRQFIKYRLQQQRV